MNIETMKIQLEFSQFILKKALDGLEPADTFLTTGDKGNGIHWVLGHILQSRDHFLSHLGIDPVFAADGGGRYGMGADPITREEDGLAHARMMELLDVSYAAMNTGLDALDPARFEEMTPWQPGSEHKDKLGRLLPGLISHETYHIGQIGLLRVLTGRGSTFS